MCDALDCHSKGHHDEFIEVFEVITKLIHLHDAPSARRTFKFHMGCQGIAINKLQNLLCCGCLAKTTLKELKACRL
jgi:hypothetical protein